MNTVLILLDDLDAASLAAAMPRLLFLSSLATQGTVFDRFFVAIPNCAPSRATLLTGRYPHTTGSWRGYRNFKPWEPRSLGPQLRAAGVRTGLFGKYMNGYPEAGAETAVPPDWDAWCALTRIGYTDYTLNVDGRLLSPPDYLTDNLAARAERFVAGTEPFFCYVPVGAPHAEPEWPRRDDDEFPTGRAPRTPAFDEADVSDKPLAIRGLPSLTAEQTKALDLEWRGRLRTLPAVDDLLGRVVLSLSNAGRLDRTLILIASDNGYQLGEHRLTEKGAPYDQSVRVPLIAFGPGVAAGRAEPRVALMTDLAPTLLDLMGAPPDDGHDGRSLRPLLAGDGAAPWRTAGLVAEPWWDALRSEDALYVEHDTGERELYDLATDPEELENRAGDPAQAGDVAVLSARLAALRGCAGEACRTAEDGVG